MHGFVIETERLILRPLKVEDADAVYEWVSDEDVALKSLTEPAKTAPWSM
jgi:RimJ/RimL family protein N-acetyltransferase